MGLTKIDDRGLKTPIDLLDNEKIRLGTGNDLELYHAGTNSLIDNNTGNLYINSAGEIYLAPNNNEAGVYVRANGAVELYYDNSKKFETSSAGVDVTGNVQATGNMQVNDNNYMYLGNSGDLNLRFLNGTGAFIQSGGNSMYIRSNLIELGDNSGHKYIKCVDGAQVELYHGVDSKKFETTSAGTKNTGVLDCTGSILLTDQSGDNIGKLRLGNGPDLEIYHDGSNSYINDTGTGNLKVLTNKLEILNAANNEYLAVATENAAVDLYYNGTKKLATTTTGIDINTGGSDLGSSIEIYGHDALKRGRWGYSSAYKGLIVGRTDSNVNSSIFMGVDPSGNTSGAFGGYGQEIIFRNDLSFYHPNNANDNWKSFMRTGRFGDTGAVCFPNGLGFGSDTATDNILDDYEEGNLSWELRKSGSNTASDNGSNVKYTKVGRMVHISGRIRTDSTGGNSNDVFVLNGSLPFTPATSGTSVVGHWRSQDIGDSKLTASFAWVGSSTTVYLYTLDAENDYAADHNNVGANNQTNLVVTFSLTYQAS